MPAPRDLLAKPSDLKHRDHGKPSTIWIYRDAAGAVLHYVARYDTTDGKQIIPWTLDGTRWRPKHAPAPRPLYALDKLAQAPHAAVLVVEGEKAADAAQRMLGTKAVVTTASGGGNAVHLADWALLAGGHVVIWPDCDSKRDKRTGEFLSWGEQPGMKAARAVADELEGIAASVRMVDVPQPGEIEDGWDLADAEAEGWGAEQVLERLAAARDAAELYHLPKLLDAQEGEIVLFVATEAIADRLASFDLLATTPPQGAGPWKDRYADQIRHIRVVAIPDSGDAGERQAQAIVASFRKRGVPAAVLRPDGPPIGGDLFAWSDHRPPTTDHRPPTTDHRRSTPCRFPRTR